MPVDPVASKQELLEMGVDFTIEDNEPEITGTADECLVYYVVTLTFCRQEAPEQAHKGQNLAFTS